MKIIIIIMFSLLMLPLVLASISYNNNNLPYVPSPSVQSLLNSNSNVSSVVSSDNCIIVSPTTGNVILTFNSSCGGSGSFDNTNIAYVNQSNPWSISQIFKGVSPQVTAKNLTSDARFRVLSNCTSAGQYLAYDFGTTSSFLGALAIPCNDKTRVQLFDSTGVFLEGSGGNVEAPNNFTAKFFKGLFNWTFVSNSPAITGNFDGAKLNLSFDTQQIITKQAGLSRCISTGNTICYLSSDGSKHGFGSSFRGDGGIYYKNSDEGNLTKFIFKTKITSCSSPGNITYEIGVRNATQEFHVIHSGVYTGVETSCTTTESVGLENLNIPLDLSLTSPWIIARLNSSMTGTISNTMFGITITEEL